jgi:hypothetical protein
MLSTLQDFEEGTAFELYVLERVRPAIEQHGGASIDLRGSKTVAAWPFPSVKACRGPR